MSGTEVNAVTRQLLASHRAGIAPVQYPERSESPAGTKRQGSVGQESFSGLLRSNMEEIRFSAHASARIRSREIEMSPEVIGKLRGAVDRAAAKGSKDALVLLRKSAFIVNIPNRTVVTAIDGESMKENIFTNIDSAVVAD